MTQVRTPFGCVSMLVFLAACDTRADGDYRGESLLHLEGRVVLADERAPEGLVPALAFSTHHGVEIVDVSVQGQFPADFRMDLYAPPPASAIEVDPRAEAPAEQGEFAIGAITAVAPDHPSQLLVASSTASWRLDPQLALGYADLASCAADQACLRAGQQCQQDARCDHVERWCLDETDSECRTVGLPKCGSDGAAADCEPLFSEGNALIVTGELEQKKFAGFSDQYVIVWTRHGMPKTAWYLAALGVQEDLAPGYSLIQLGTAPDDPADSSSASDTDSSAGIGTVAGTAQSGTDPCAGERAPRAPLDSAACLGSQCVELFESETFARYNERHGTSFRCLAEVDELEFREASEIEDELTYIAEKLAIARGISVAELVGTKVIHDRNIKLSIHISPDAEPPVIF